jgi:2-haloacid dehalogenase
LRACKVSSTRPAAPVAIIAGHVSARTDLSAVRVLLFDVFGTLVDWHTAVADELRAVGAARGAQADWGAVADGWRARYAPTLDRVNRGERAWANLDVLHRETLDDVLAEHGVDGLDDGDRDRLVAAWHRLPPWPEVRDGLTRLRARFVLATLSNGHVALLVDLARHGELPFDTILSAELADRRYKPDPTVYRRALELLDAAPGEAMMVATHPSDLRAAGALGLRTGFVHRPLEHGPDRPSPAPAPEFDVHAADLLDLARQLGT